MPKLVPNRSLGRGRGPTDSCGVPVVRCAPLIAMTPPSTAWAETVGDDEAAQHEGFARVITYLQTRINDKSGPGRAFHRKPIAALSGTLTVNESLPDYAAQGLFAEAGVHPVVARLSNGAIVANPDAVPDIRGFAFSVRDIDGPGALGGATDRQDFLLINWPAFGFRDSVDFAEIVEATADGQLGLLKYFIQRDGTLRGSAAMARQAAAIARPFSGFATAGFHSCAPIQWGPYAAQVHLKPVGAKVNLLAWRNFSADIEDRVATAPLKWEIQAQFFTDEQATPIEDLRRPWDAPKVVVGELVLDTLADTAEVEADHFDPWSALEEHRPLGEVMRARKAAYYPSVQNRRR